MIFRSSGIASDRDIDCEAAMEAEFEALIDRALAAGWSEDEVTNALLSLAQNRVDASRADAFIGAEPPAGRLSH
ncbi:MAG: hypothetical protein Kow0026_07750 [Oricola sp.]